MLLSKQNMFSDGQDLSQTAGTYYSDSIDLGATGTPARGQSALVRDVGKGQPVGLFIDIDETFTSAGAATLAVTLQESTDNSSFTDVQATATLALATLVAGYRFGWNYLPEGITKRYLRLKYVIGTATTTAGTVTAALSLGNESNM